MGTLAPPTDEEVAARVERIQLRPLAEAESVFASTWAALQMLRARRTRGELPSLSLPELTRWLEDVEVAWFRRAAEAAADHIAARDAVDLVTRVH